MFPWLSLTYSKKIQNSPTFPDFPWLCWKRYLFPWLSRQYEPCTGVTIIWCEFYRGLKLGHIFHWGGISPGHWCRGVTSTRVRYLPSFYKYARIPISHKQMPKGRNHKPTISASSAEFWLQKHLDSMPSWNPICWKPQRKIQVMMSTPVKFCPYFSTTVEFVWLTDWLQTDWLRLLSK